MSHSVDGSPVIDGPSDPTCLFCSIVRGDTTATIVDETRETVAFLDHRPLFFGHTLLIPRPHYVTLPDLPADLVAPLFTQAQRLARSMGDAFGAAGTFVAMNNVVSQSVPHLHVHVVPRNRKDGLKGFFWPRTKYRDGDHMSEVAAQIRAALADTQG